MACAAGRQAAVGEGADHDAVGCGGGGGGVVQGEFEGHRTDSGKGESRQSSVQWAAVTRASATVARRVMTRGRNPGERTRKSKAPRPDAEA